MKNRGLLSLKLGIHMTMVEIKKDSIERVYTPIEHSWLIRSREPYIPKGLGS